VARLPDLAGSTIATQPGPLASAVGDLDGDGDLDVVTTNKFANTLTVFANDGTGALTPALTIPAADGPTPIVVEDLDGDGRLDIAVANGFSNDAVLYLAR